MGKLTSGKPLSTALAYRSQHFKFICLFLISMAVLSCSGFPLRETRPRGVYHRVKSGESLSAIARAYRVDFQELAEINNISHPDRIKADSVIFIPDVTQIPDDIMIAAGQRERSPALQAERKREIKETAVSGEAIPRAGAAGDGKTQSNPPIEAPARHRPVLSPAAEKDVSTRKSVGTPENRESSGLPARPKEGGEKPEQKIRFEKQRFIWPVKGTVISPFGIQPNRMYFNGIRIAAAQGTAIQAAADGLVIFSAPLKDYGETIIIQHEDHYATVYAHLGTRTVQGDAKVRKGGRIAFVGNAATKEEPSLHFEIRHNNRARNPLFFLP